jgi:starch synthase
LCAVDRALAAYQKKSCWTTLMKNAMTADHSWSRSAREYLRLYKKLLGVDRPGAEDDMPAQRQS